ncbi:MAG: carboxypeptidase-like regulatory domain-containing protein, partial [bacterium]
MRRLATVVALAVAALDAAAAQRPAPIAHIVRGTVFDSMARAVLPNAVVQLARIAAGDSAPAIVTAVTDDAGRYRFAGLPD